MTAYRPIDWAKITICCFTIFAVLYLVLGVVLEFFGYEAAR